MILSCMRYGSPSIEMKLEELTDANCNEIICLPMFPQFSKTTTGSIMAKLKKIKNEYGTAPEIKVLKDFSSDSRYIDALFTHLSKYYEKDSNEHLVLSFHGIPVSYVGRGDKYQLYCQETIALLIQRFQLNNDQYTITFQSRFGPDPWLKPYTDKKIEELSKSNIKVAVFCPGFLVDCLETLDEMGNEARMIYEKSRGPSFRVIPCLNDSPELINAMIEIFEDKDKFETI